MPMSIPAGSRSPGRSSPSEDDLVSEEDLHVWEAHAMAAWPLKIYPGDHFYLRSSPQPVIEDIAQPFGVSAFAGMDA